MQPTPTPFADAGSAPPGATLSPAPDFGGKTTLHLGVLEQLYRTPSRAVRRGKTRAPGIKAVSTYDVAKILEAKYGVMAAFYSRHEEDIAKAIEESMGGALESMLMRQPVNPYAAATQKIETMFRDFISTREVEGLGIHGVPTAAALRGVNHRLAHPYRKSNPPRPSFRDTGLYLTSFRCWTSSSR